MRVFQVQLVLFVAIAGLLGNVWPATASAQSELPLECRKRGPSRQWGVLDYRIADRDRLNLVESFHFTPSVEALEKGSTSMYIGKDLGYTLDRFVNHHRALMSMMNLGFREKTSTPKGAGLSVECYIMRAEYYFPDDAMVKAIYGLFLLKAGREKEALSKLDAAQKLDPGNANVHYNLGLAYVRLKQFDDALASAHRAYGLGFPLPGLRDQLKRAGKWREPLTRSAVDATSDLRAGERVEPR